MSMKAEVMTKILNDAKEAKPIEALGKNTYDPINYNKVRGERIMMANLQDAQNGFYTPTYMPGDVEFDSLGRLKKIGRTAPKLIDERVYSANKFKLIETPVEGKKDKDGSDKTVKEILVVFGQAIVKAIEQTNELPPQVKAFRFRKQGFAWNFLGAEFISEHEVRTFTGTLDPASYYKLQQAMNKRAEETAGKAEGTSLNDL